MKKFLLITAGLAFLAGVTSGQEYKSRLPTPAEQNRIAGTTKYIQDTYLQLTTPKLVTSSPYFATNYNDGVLIVHGAAGNYLITLPNPTNNVGRRYQISAVHPAKVLLTNNNAGWKFFNLATAGNDVGVFCETNKSAIVFSTGTNWAVHCP